MLGSVSILSRSLAHPLAGCANGFWQVRETVVVENGKSRSEVWVLGWIKLPVRIRWRPGRTTAGGAAA
jgi:hypothetical protein